MQLAGKPMSTSCAKHVVAKAATASANFIVVAIEESLELVGPMSALIEIRYYRTIGIQ